MTVKGTNLIGSIMKTISTDSTGNRCHPSAKTSKNHMSMTKSK